MLVEVEQERGWSHDNKSNQKYFKKINVIKIIIIKLDATKTEMQTLLQRWAYAGW